MRIIYTDGSIYEFSDMCGCGQMDTVGYCPKCMGLNIIEIPSPFQTIDLGNHWEFKREEIYERE